ncbi:MAG: DnaJ domain-containing protein [Bdellovibrionota bacterium]
MSSFSKILQEKLKKEDLHRSEIGRETEEETSARSENSGLSAELLRWLSSPADISPDVSQGQKHSSKVGEFSYSIYKKDPKVIAARRLEREKIELNEFLTHILLEKDKTAVRFFYAQGARSFMSMSGSDLKKDYKKLAMKLHPDRHFNEIPSVQKQSQEDFRVLSESYDTLRMLFRLTK